MDQPLTRIRARNFRSLADVDVQLSPLSVMIGPNGSGKTNLLNVLRFLATTARLDLVEAMDAWGGSSHVFRQAPRSGRIQLTVEGAVSRYSSLTAPDSYKLQIDRRLGRLVRKEEFTFKRTRGQGRRITVKGNEVTIVDEERQSNQLQFDDSRTTGLATLPRFSDEEGGQGIRDFARFLSSIRVLEPVVSYARSPARPADEGLREDASNLAAALYSLSVADPAAWEDLKSDLRRCLPGLMDVELAEVGGASRQVVVRLREAGLTRPIELIDASFGTVRLLALLVALHEPHPPALTAIEEVDHGLHPYALDILIDRMRQASSRTQILAATHSPTLVNRLAADEIIVCDRDPDSGASIIPAISTAAIKAALASSEFRAGEAWFAGALHGVPA